MLSSLGRQGEVAQATRHDFSAVLTKPVKASQLYNALAGVFSVPAASAKEPPTRPQIDSDMGKRHPLRILLAEDNLVNQKVALVLLEKLSYHVDVAGDGREVLELLETQVYDVVLMDVHMPHMDGLEATRHIIERWPARQRPRIIAMTASAMQGDRERFLAAGMDEYISKPVRMDALSRVLEDSRPLTPPEDSRSIPSTDSSGDVDSRGAQTSLSIGPAGRRALEAIDRAVLETLKSNVSEIVGELIDMYFESAPKLLADMRQAVIDADTGSLFRTAHTLKPSSATLGAISLATLCEELEIMGRVGLLEGALEVVVQAEAEYERVRVVLEAEREALAQDLVLVQSA